MSFLPETPWTTHRTRYNICGDGIQIVPIWDDSLLQSLQSPNTSIISEERRKIFVEISRAFARVSGVLILGKQRRTHFSLALG